MTLVVASAPVIDGARLQALIEERKTSQAELARRVGISQSAINRLTSGENYGSKHIHRIAQALGTTPAYLERETDDPDAGAPAPVPEPLIQHLMLPVALPSERALAQMFEALLAGLPEKADQAERALLLARRLPIGLSQARDLLPSPPSPARSPAKGARSRQLEPQS